MRRLSLLRDSVEQWLELNKQSATIFELIGLAIDDNELSLRDSLDAELTSLENILQQLEFELVFSGPYDDRAAIIGIHAGAGGTESQDWAQMLLRMYLRWGDRSGHQARIINMSPGDEAGIKSALVEVSGKTSYGYLKAERGVHRLVRISPFDSAHARHTSFALVEVLPQAEEDIDIEIKSDDIRIDAFKAGGHGGQSVQKNATAIRITHIPTGIVALCQNERSQIQNKESAMKVLRARVMELEIKRRSEKQNELKGEHISAEWGNQIRSYILHPYKIVKDHRTGFDSTDPTAVLDGDLDPLLKSFLLSTIGSQ